MFILSFVALDNLILHALWLRHLEIHNCGYWTLFLVVARTKSVKKPKEQKPAQPPQLKEKPAR
jgi:hypothetical protein